MTPPGHRAAMIAVADVRASAWRRIRMARRERPSRVAAVGRDPKSAVPDGCARMSISVGAVPVAFEA